VLAVDLGVPALLQDLAPRIEVRGSRLADRHLTLVQGLVRGLESDVVVVERHGLIGCRAADAGEAGGDVAARRDGVGAVPLLEVRTDGRPAEIDRGRLEIRSDVSAEVAAHLVDAATALVDGGGQLADGLVDRRGGLRIWTGDWEAALDASFLAFGEGLDSGLQEL
jgi:hypothetical protein